MGCFLFLPGRARGPNARRPAPTHTIYYSALVGGGRRPFGPHLAAAKVSHTLSAEHVGRGGCPQWVVFCSSQAGRVVQTRGAPHQPTLFTIPRWLAGGAAHLDHTWPPRRSLGRGARASPNVCTSCPGGPETMLIRMPEIPKQDNSITFCMPGPPGQHPLGDKLARRAKCYTPTAPRNVARGGRRE